MFKKWTLLSLFTVFSISLWAQNTVSGTVFEFANKRQVLELVTVKNLTTEALAATNDKGKFTIIAKTGDLLEFTKAGYAADTILLIDQKHKNIFLSERSTAIQEVEINTTKVSPMLILKDAEAKEYKRLMTEDVHRKKNTDRAGGINLSLGYGKYRRAQALEAALTEQELYEDEIRENFNEKTVGKFLKISGQDLLDYMDVYRPTHGQIRVQRPFNYEYYMVTTYSTWKNLTPEGKKAMMLPRLKGNP